MKKLIQSVSAVLFCGIFSTSSVIASPEYWQKVKRPISGEPEPVGSYSNGCIIGAKPLPFNGEGYQVIRTSKNRYYGHPDMIAYLQRLGKKVKQAGIPTMLIGDIAMPGGGRFLTGHASHQMGLDADIWLRLGRLSDKDAQNPAGMGLLVVDRKAQRVDDSVWTENHVNLIRLAAQDKQVARIFVNPAIKVKLCQTVRGDRSWLQKIRPWFGHDSHFHVRLTCPQGAKYCENQAPIPAGEGCGEELYSWFKPAKPSTGSVKPKPRPPEPFLCQQVSSSPNQSEWLE
ncbi:MULTISPECIES: penicillin-insensitive murein endopeptidase [unclassified Avibacterium]|uniref:penicillin-insensitive murein endopeptidase n=1 Tax=unclassified Avibacterium TaxID=2685287 RepID=UPI002026D56D|nr:MULTISPECIES: penicillin-insensitive murein endopeptidase [unclassified Avibacterium]MCW9718015.1 penicillin-insensitive murein endopeptidase [Avibacterium sp. 21-599]MCW9733629.1 penicillin-insensitive murein endopeptidase [Avibacterium sp. 20-15]URL03484.1 penicillin-insensitive murein endopeptidase [Avibacterium sp. 20-132]